MARVIHIGVFSQQYALGTLGDQANAGFVHTAYRRGWFAPAE